jgi:hypothetical protein
MSGDIYEDDLLSDWDKRFYELCLEEMERLAKETGRDPESITVNDVYDAALARLNRPLVPPIQMPDGLRVHVNAISHGLTADDIEEEDE